jgi:hypothetical protein
VDAGLSEIRTALADLVRSSDEEKIRSSVPLPPGTRILTDSRAGRSRGVQSYEAPSGTQAHLAGEWGLRSDAGRLIALLGMGRMLPEIHRQIVERWGPTGLEPERHYRTVFLPALLDALRRPASDNELRLRLPGGPRVSLLFAGAQHAGALDVCKNGALFPSAFRIELEGGGETLLARWPVTRVGFAESSLRLRGETWAGYRNLGLLFGAPLNDDDGGSATEDDGEPEPPPEPPPEPEGGLDRGSHDLPDVPGRPEPPPPPPPGPENLPGRNPGAGAPPVPTAPGRPVD